MRTKFLSVLSLLILLFVMTACGSNNEAAPEVRSPADDDILMLGLVVNVSGIDDGGFNQLAHGATTSLTRRINADFEYVILNIESDYLDQMRTFVNEATTPFDIVVTVGFDLGEATTTVATEHPDIHFVGIDQFQVEPLPNLTGVLFHEDQAGYLAGVLAANLTQSGIVGGVYGTNEVPPVVAFAEGFELGVQAVNPDITVLTEYHPEGAATAFTDVAWGEETAAALIEAGADVIFTAAGDTGRGALIEVANTTDDLETPLYCIGVDTDQWLTVPQAHDCLVTSAVKSIPQGIDAAITEILNGNAPSGNYYGPVGIASYHDFEDMIPDSVKAQLDMLTDQLQRGEVTTGYGES